MWRIEGQLDRPDTPYDRRAAVYDRLVRSPLYNRLAWSTSPDDYTRFAAAAIASGDGPLLEVAAGSAAATAELHAHSTRPTVLVDLSRAMLERAAQRIAAASGAHQLPRHIRLIQDDLFAASLPAPGFTTVLGLGITHLFDDLPGLVTAMRRLAAPDGQLHVTGLVAETRRGRRYLARAPAPSRSGRRAEDGRGDPRRARPAGDLPHDRLHGLRHAARCLTQAGPAGLAPDG